MVTQNSILGNISDISSGKLASQPTKRNPGQELDKNAFLSLLTTQLKNQDPMNPMDNTQMMSQMAQFSSLEQMNNLNQSFEYLKGINIIGRTVTAFDVNNQQTTVGNVVSVSKEGSQIFANVRTQSGDVNVKIGDIQKVE